MNVSYSRLRAVKLYPVNQTLSAMHADGARAWDREDVHWVRADTLTSKTMGRGRSDVRLQRKITWHHTCENGERFESSGVTSSPNRRVLCIVWWGCARSWLLWSFLRQERQTSQVSSGIHVKEFFVLLSFPIIELKITQCNVQWAEWLNLLNIAVASVWHISRPRLLDFKQDHRL